MSIANRIRLLQESIQDYELAYSRKPHSVRLLAVSKGQSTTAIQEAFNAGIPCFGENYVQEALQKIQTLSSLPIEWHFIGAIQSNKCALVANHFSWIHSLSRIKIAHALNDARDPLLPKLNVCIQVNLDKESTKSGVTADELTHLAKAISTLPRLQLRGLMILPKPKKNHEQYTTFMQLNELMQELNLQLNLNLDTLSMGMSHDFEMAIRAGSTIIRIGRAIFDSVD